MLSPVSTQSTLAADQIHHKNPLPLQNKGKILQESSLASLGRRSIGLKEAFLQLLDTAFYLAVFPLYVYAFFLTATFSLIALHFLIILAPIVLATRAMRGILHMLFIYEPLKRAMGGSPSFDEVLLWTIHNGYGEHEGGKWDIPWFLDKLQEWVDRPGTVLFRFEELCGQCGGGSREAQFEAFRRLGRLLSIELTDRECIHISRELFGKSKQGVSWTFRSGQIGSWKEHFKPEHVAAFKEELGEVLIKLGYEDDYDW